MWHMIWFLVGLVVGGLGGVGWGLYLAVSVFDGDRPRGDE